MTKQLKDLVLEVVKPHITTYEYEQVKMTLEDYEDLLRDNLELQEQLSKYEQIN